MDRLYAKNRRSPIAPDKLSIQKYKELVHKLDSVFTTSLAVDTVESARDIPFTTLFSLSEMVMYSLVKYDEIMLQVMAPEYQEKFLPSHSINTAFLSCTVGMNMNLSFKELSELCVAALLHDVGMLKVDPGFYEHNRELSRDQRKAIEDHPAYGYQLLANIESEFPWLIRVVVEEHKRANGQGYPRLKDAPDDLHLYSKIIGVCDTFEALTHSRPHRKAYHPGDVIKIVIDARREEFDSDVLRALIEGVSLFPIGSLVQLNNNKNAEVIKSVIGAPLRPVVKILDAELIDGVEGSVVINLSEEKNLYVAGLAYDERYLIPEQFDE
jgi:HD-GYP domain-containing protein (c-di-GMP phosphodiesterase class II)